MQYELLQCNDRRDVAISKCYWDSLQRRALLKRRRKRRLNRQRKRRRKRPPWQQTRQMTILTRQTRKGTRPSLI